ncbi:MAG: hypothetical protein QG577_1900 [Thermodesulfobacteriota bacterium]|nr:hypothetical protein [Thermodesulfobacteriota bacterium]
MRLSVGVNKSVLICGGNSISHTDQPVSEKRIMQGRAAARLRGQQDEFGKVVSCEKKFLGTLPVARELNKHYLN